MTTRCARARCPSPPLSRRGRRSTPTGSPDPRSLQDEGPRGVRLARPARADEAGRPPQLDDRRPGDGKARAKNGKVEPFAVKVRRTRAGIAGADRAPAEV